jgi:hypothetical protein
MAMLPMPKNLATRPTVGGTVDRKVRPITAAKTSSTASVLGASRNTSTATARVAYTSASSDFMRQRPTAQPMARLPTMLNSPMMPSAQAPTGAGRPRAATTPGRCVARKATWKPQTKKPAASMR